MPKIKFKYLPDEAGKLHHSVRLLHKKDDHTLWHPSCENIDPTEAEAKLAVAMIQAIKGKPFQRYYFREVKITSKKFLGFLWTVHRFEDTGRIVDIDLNYNEDEPSLEELGFKLHKISEEKTTPKEILGPLPPKEIL